MNKIHPSIELVTELSEFAHLQADWAEVLGQSQQECVFLSWEWLYTWWQVFSSPADRLQVLLIKQDGELIGIAPFYLQGRGFVRGATLRFIGTGEAKQDQVVSEYLDLFSRTGKEKMVIAAVAIWLRDSIAWRMIEFNDMLDSALLLRTLDSNSVLANREKSVSGFRYSISLPDSFDTYLQSLSASRRKRFKRCRVALEKDGGDAKGVFIRDATAVDSAMATLKTLNDARWQRRVGRGVFESARFFNFHCRVCERLWHSGQADINIISLAGKPIAALYLFYTGPVCHYYQSGFLSEGANRYMPLLLGHMAQIENCISRKQRSGRGGLIVNGIKNGVEKRGEIEGKSRTKIVDQAQAGNIARYDFMRGAAESYKKDYGCESNPMYTMRVWRYPVQQKLSSARSLLRRKTAAFLRSRGLRM